MKKPTRAELAEGQKDLDEFLRGPCKAVVGFEYGSCIYHVETKAGTLRVCPRFEAKFLPWIACRFLDLPRAIKHFNCPVNKRHHHRLNHRSAKWNFHSSWTPQELVESFIVEVKKILP